MENKNFDLNALFGKVIEKNKPKKAKDNKEPAQEKDTAEEIEFDVKSKIESVKLYEKINKKLQKTIQTETEKGTISLQGLATDPHKFSDKIENKQFLLDKFFNPKKNATTKRSLMINSKFKKERRLFEIKPNKYSYKMFLPLNDAWHIYVKELISNEKSLETILNKLLKADYHGAIIKILRSKCKTYEGQSGIVLMETLKTFKIITKFNQVSTILKKDCVFLVEVLGQPFKIFGWHMQYRPADRLRAKFKTRIFETMEN